MTLDVPSETSAWRAVVRVLRSPLPALRMPLDALCTTLFPALCCLCSNPLLRFTRIPVCDSCWGDLHPQTSILCYLCGEDLGFSDFSYGDPRPVEERLCQPCRLAPPPFRRAVAYGVYQDTLRALIHMLKYESMPAAAVPLGRVLAGCIAKVADEMPPRLLVVPVPLHRLKRHSRGFNHAELLASAAVHSLRRSCPEKVFDLAPDLLRRQRATQSQAGLTSHQRRVNLRGAFFAPQPERVREQNILLIDDIYTTGATARACSRALLDAGAASVWVATLARAQREGVAFWNPGFKKTAVSAALTKQATKFVTAASVIDR